MATLMVFNIITLFSLPYIAAIQLLIITSIIAITGFISILPVSFYLWYKFENQSAKDFFLISILCLLSSLSLIITDRWTNIDISNAQYWIMVQLIQTIFFVLIFASIINKLNDLKNRHNKMQAETNAKSDFLAKMSHEIRTPMSGVLGMSELMSETELNDQQKYYNDMIYKSGRNLLSVINDVLDYSKISAGKMALDESNFEITKVAKDVVGLFSIMASDKNIDLICRIAPTLPLYWYGDENRIRQILINLLGNALKFTHNGEIFINIDQTLPPKYPTSNIQQLEISIKDSGIGIEEKLQASIFDDFSQADTSTSRRYGGTGLGLSICKQLVELMGGTISLKSRYGMGSTFSFSLPLTPNPEVIYKAPTTLNNIHLLLVDDNESYRCIVEERLKDSNIHLSLAKDSEQALSILAQEKELQHDFDLIVLDIHMPYMDGITLAQKIVTQNLSKAAILLLSSVQTIPKIKEYKSWGVNYAAQKPILTNELFPLFIHTLGLHSGKIIIPHSLEDKPKISSRHIMIVEDNDVNFQVISILLKKKKHRVQRALNGLEALELFKANNLPVNSPNCFDIILMDCEMPEMDGYQATERIRLLEIEYHLAHTPIIALTAHAVEEHLKKCLLAGMDDIITKPFNQQQIDQLFSQVFA